jgi:hypothetical protein
MGKQFPQVRQISPQSPEHVADLDLSRVAGCGELFVPLCTIVNISLLDQVTLRKMPDWILSVFNKDISPAIPINNPDYSRLSPLQAQFVAIKEAAQKGECNKLVVVDSLGLQLINLDGLINFIHALDHSFTPVQLSRSDMLTHLEPKYRTNTIAKALEKAKLCSDVKFPTDMLKEVELTASSDTKFKTSFFNWEALILSKHLSLRRYIDSFIEETIQKLVADSSVVHEALQAAILFNVKDLFKSYQKILLENKTSISSKYLQPEPAQLKESEQACIATILNHWQAKLPNTIKEWAADPVLKVCLETVTRYLVEEMIVIGLCMGPAIHPWVHGKEAETQLQGRGTFFLKALAPTLKSFLLTFGRELGLKDSSEAIDEIVLPWVHPDERDGQELDLPNYFININVNVHTKDFSMLIVADPHEAGVAPAFESKSVGGTPTNSQPTSPLLQPQIFHQHKRKHSDERNRSKTGSSNSSRAGSPLSDEQLAFRQKEMETHHRQLDAEIRKKEAEAAEMEYKAKLAELEVQRKKAEAEAAKIEIEKRKEAEAKDMEYKARLAELELTRREAEIKLLLKQQEYWEEAKTTRISPLALPTTATTAATNFYRAQPELAVEHQQGMSEVQGPLEDEREKSRAIATRTALATVGFFPADGQLTQRNQAEAPQHTSRVSDSSSPAGHDATLDQLTLGAA